MGYSYLVTTRNQIIPSDASQIIMVDGTTPGWVPRPQDLHFDHHRKDGAPIQLDEIPQKIEINPTACFVSTQVDADLIVASVYLQLVAEGKLLPEEIILKLRAIAWACDHLVVPSELENLAQFATQAVATLKSRSDKVINQLRLPSDRRNWSIDQKEAYASATFKEGVEWVAGACFGNRAWPGQLGEAAQYWEKVEANIQMIVNKSRIKIYRDCLLFDGKGLGGRYIDPRCWLKAAEQMKLKSKTAITLAQREVFVENKFKGFSYTLGCVPLHPALTNLDYTKDVFDALTRKEKEINPHADGWGGRKTVGGSGWNTSSHLTPQEVIDIVLSVTNKQ